MQPLNPTKPTELTPALMENDLLRYEVRHLRARLATLTDKVDQLKADLADLAEQAEETGTDGKRSRSGKGAKRPVVAKGATGEDPERRNAQAYDDLVWLLHRLDSSPAGFALRRVKGFQVLRARYVQDPEN